MISSDGMRRIEAAVAEAETATSAELVAVVAQRAGEYRSTGLTIAILGSFLAGFGVWLLSPWSGAGEVLFVEFAAFLVLFAGLELTPLGDRLTPDFLKTEAARRLARSVFLEHGLAATPERNAVMFFVSGAERYVEVIADEGAAARISAAEWNGIIDSFSESVRAGRMEEGYLGAIASLRGLLAKNFPPEQSSPNRISNRVIEL